MGFYTSVLEEDERVGRFQIFRIKVKKNRVALYVEAETAVNLNTTPLVLKLQGLERVRTVKSSPTVKLTRAKYSRKGILSNISGQLKFSLNGIAVCENNSQYNLVNSLVGATNDIDLYITLATTSLVANKLRPIMEKKESC